MIEVRMIAVAGNAERATAQDGDVVRLGRIRNALPMLRERVLVRQLRHVRGGTVDVREIVVLHQHDDELVEVARGLRRHVSRRCDRHRSCDRNETRSEQRYDDEQDCGEGGAEGSLHARAPGRTERTSANTIGGGCGQPEGGIRAPAKATSPHPCCRYMATRSRLSLVVAAM